MNKMMTKVGLGVTLAATVLTAAAPAEAQRWRGRGYYRGGDVAGAALVGGIVGLGVGAAIASNRGPYYGGYYGPAYYGPAYYGPRVVYAPVYRPRYWAPRAYYRPVYRYRGYRRW